MVLSTKNRQAAAKDSSTTANKGAEELMTSLKCNAQNNVPENLPQTIPSSESTISQPPVGAKTEVLSGEGKISKANAAQEVNGSSAKLEPEYIVQHNAAKEVLQNSPLGHLAGQVLDEANPRLSSKSKTASKTGAAMGTTNLTSSKPTSEYNWTNICHNLSHIFKTVSHLFWPIIATLLFLIVAPILIRGTSVGWPLSKLTPPMGTFILSLFSKLTDFVLDWGADTVWEMVHWGPLLRKGEELLTFLAFTSDIDGWVRLIFFRSGWSSKDFEKRKHSHIEQHCDLSGSRQSGPNESSTRNLQTGKAKSFIEVSKAPGKDASRFHVRYFRLWSLFRLLIWGVIQFPGVIMMTIINSETDYIPANWTRTSGGMGVFDTSAITLGVTDPTVWAYIFYLVRDATMSYPVDPVSADCSASDSCESFLLPGGLRSVTPWPYGVSTDKRFTSYITKDAPAYQMDVWDAPSDTQWDPNDCIVYGAPGFDNSTAFQLCISYSDGHTDQLLAGWRFCPVPFTVLPSGECSQAGSWSSSRSWATYIVFSRRLATTTYDRYSSQVLKVSSLRPPAVQEIPPKNFTAAFNTMICPLTNSTEISTYCIGSGSLNIVTSTIASDILLYEGTSTSSIPLDVLRNLFGTSVFFFNPVNTQSVPSPSVVQSGLPPENYFMGSPARPIIFVAPVRWTAEAYAAVMGTLLLLGWVVIVYAKKSDPRECGPFPFMNFLTLGWRIETGSDIDQKQHFEGGEKKRREIFTNFMDMKVTLKGDTMKMEGSDS
ncbi:hypothetical protein N431DRAFT_458803 [Stipitochalara longipes BDJ]|nr:hypothetical protein N431DRAFT_458803 [Stipitochalara longipes BDJ]